MATSSKPPLCNVIYIYFKVTLSSVKNQEEVERSVCSYVLSMQRQQASDDEIYERLNNMCNDIGCHLKIYEDTILPFQDTSGAATAVHRKILFEDAIDAAASAQRKFPFDDTSRKLQLRRRMLKKRHPMICLRILRNFKQANLLRIN